MSCGVGLRVGSDPTWPWLWHRPVATAPIRPLAWEPPYTAGAALEKAKRLTKQNKTKNFIFSHRYCFSGSMEEFVFLSSAPVIPKGCQIWEF